MKSPCLNLLLSSVFATCVLFVSSCGSSSDDTLEEIIETITDNDDEQEDDKVKLSLTAVVRPTSTYATTSRLASYSSRSFESGDTIGLFILASDLSSPYDTKTNCYNAPAVYNGSGFDILNDVYLTTDYAYIAAYYPYSKSYGNKFPDSSSSSFLPISLVPSVTEQNYVLTFYSDKCNNSNSQASLIFTHSLSTIELSITLAGDVGEGQLTSISISADDSGLYSSALLAFGEDSFGLCAVDGDSYKTDELIMSCDTTLTLSDPTDFYFNIHPSSSSDLNLNMAISNSTLSVELPSVGGWEPAYRYVYDITASLDKLEVNSVTVIDEWGNGGTTDEIIVEYQEPYYNGHEAVDLGLGVMWATCNIGADTEEEFGDYFAWGETSTKDAFTYSNSVTYGLSDVVSISGNAEYDAASAIWGDDWRMPTLGDIDDLYSECTWQGTTINGNYGYKITSKINGNYIFLPAAGLYTEDGFYKGLLSNFVVTVSNSVANGHCAYYWSAISSTGNTSQCFFYLSYSGITLSVHGSQNNNIPRYYGLPIRPVID